MNANLALKYIVNKSCLITHSWFDPAVSQTTQMAGKLGNEVPEDGERGGGRQGSEAQAAEISVLPEQQLMCDMQQ